MKQNNLTVNVFGLDDPGADLTIVGACDTCGAEIWRRKYVEEDLKHLGLHQLLKQVQADVQEDRDQFVDHHCIVH